MAEGPLLLFLALCSAPPPSTDDGHFCRVPEGYDAEHSSPETADDSVKKTTGVGRPGEDVVFTHLLPHSAYAVGAQIRMTFHSVGTACTF